MAFAVYHAPTDFVRTGNNADLTAMLRYLSIKAGDSSTSTSGTQNVTVVRPPVVLVHGIWGDPNDFMSAGGGGAYGALADSQLFYTVAFARYDVPVTVSSSNPAYGSGVLFTKGNTLGFVYGTTVILPRISEVTTDYKIANPSGGVIAAVQADVVARSIGGDIARTLPQIPGYADQKTYALGYVHKLITIDTPHQGTPLASALHNPNESNSCVQQMLSRVGRYAFVTVTQSTGIFTNGATGDLQTNSMAILAIHGGSPIIPTAMIGGQMTSPQLAGAGTPPSLGWAGLGFRDSLSHELYCATTESGWSELESIDGRRERRHRAVLKSI